MYLNININYKIMDATGTEKDSTLLKVSTANDFCPSSCCYTFNSCHWAT